jgi:hypothetical protein
MTDKRCPHSDILLQSECDICTPPVVTEGRSEGAPKLAMEALADADRLAEEATKLMLAAPSPAPDGGVSYELDGDEIEVTFHPAPPVQPSEGCQP